MSHSRVSTQKLRFNNIRIEEEGAAKGKAIKKTQTG